MTIHEHHVIIDINRKFGLGLFKVDWYTGVTITAGVALPSWGVSSFAEGTVTNDTIELDISQDSVMTGLLFGVLVEFNFSVHAEVKIIGHFQFRAWKMPKWVYSHWEELVDFSLNLSIDLLPIVVDLIVSLAKLVPGLKKILAILPSGLLSDLQDYKTGINAENGVDLALKIPMKWDVVYIFRQLAELGLEVLSGPVAEIVVPLVEFADDVEEVLESVGFSIKMGPQINIVFPLRVQLTNLVADDVVFDDIDFGETVKGTNPSGALDVVNTPVRRIGYRFETTVNYISVEVGVWIKVTFLKILSIGGSKTSDVVKLIEDITGKEIDMSAITHNSSMTNAIGDDGLKHDGKDNPSINIQVEFV